MKNHGLIRYAQLHEIEAGEGEVAMALDSDEDTRAKYPFDFHYEIRYRLEGAKLHVTYFITNTGNRDMPFSFGLHPGFRCPLCEGERFEDYTVRFSQPEEMTQLVMDLSGKTPYENKAVSLQEIPCDYALFAQYSTLIYRGMKEQLRHAGRQGASRRKGRHQRVSAVRGMDGGHGRSVHLPGAMVWTQ